MGKPAFSICKNEEAHQLHGNCEADQLHCFHYMDSTIPLLPKSEISSLYTSTVAVQPGLCRTWLETPKTGFSLSSSYMSHVERKPVFWVSTRSNTNRAAQPQKMTGGLKFHSSIHTSIHPSIHSIFTFSMHSP